MGRRGTVFSREYSVIVIENLYSTAKVQDNSEVLLC